MKKKLVNEKLVERFKNMMDLTRQVNIGFSCLDANQEDWSNDEKEALKNDNIVNASFEAANVNHDFKLEHTRTCWKLSLIDTNLETNNLIENINALLENYYDYCKDHDDDIDDYCSLEEYLKNNGINVTDNIVVQYIKEHLEEINKDFKEKHKDNVPPLELIREPDFNNEIFIGEVFHYP